MNTALAKQVLEAALLAHTEPMPVSELRRLFDDELDAETIRLLLEDLQREWVGRGVELVPLASGWRFQTRPEMREYLDKLKKRKTAAIFACHDGDLGDHCLSSASHAR